MTAATRRREAAHMAAETKRLAAVTVADDTTFAQLAALGFVSCRDRVRSANVRVSYLAQVAYQSVRDGEATPAEAIATWRAGMRAEGLA